jgi:DNA polymerase-3 subunit chi
VLVDFYHLASVPLERVLPSVCEKVLAGGGRLPVVAEESRLERIDEQLWTYSPDAFLPHGRERAEGQPILLSPAPEPTNGAANIALADGLWREAALGFERAFFFFDTSRRDAARDVWRSLNEGPGIETRLWKQDDRGKWVQGP